MAEIEDLKHEINEIKRIVKDMKKALGITSKGSKKAVSARETAGSAYGHKDEMKMIKDDLEIVKEQMAQREYAEEDLDQRLIYSDKKLVAGVKQSKREADAGKGKILRSDKEIDRYFEAL